MSIISLVNAIPLLDMKERYINALHTVGYFSDPYRKTVPGSFIAVPKSQLTGCSNSKRCLTDRAIYKLSCDQNHENAYLTVPKEDLKTFRDNMINCINGRADYTQECCGGRIDPGHMAQVLLAEKNLVGAKHRMRLIQMKKDKGAAIMERLKKSAGERSLPPKKRFLLKHLLQEHKKMETFEFNKPAKAKKSVKKSVKRSTKKSVKKSVKKSTKPRSVVAKAV
jgi:hypothetical protein